MQTCNHTQMQYFEIWEPKYSTKTVQLKARKVGLHNKIVFTKAPSMGAQPYYVSGKTVKKYKKESNGTIDCFSVPLSELESLEIKHGCVHLI